MRLTFIDIQEKETELTHCGETDFQWIQETETELTHCGETEI